MATSRLPAGPSILLVVGAVLSLVAVAHHAREFLVLGRGAGPLAAFLLDGLPALGLAYAGYRLSGSDLPRAGQWQGCRWSVTGSVLFVAVMGATFLIRVIEDDPSRSRSSPC